MVGLREQLAREQEVSAAYRDGRTLAFAEAATLVLTLLEEVATPTPTPTPTPTSGAEAVPGPAAHARAAASGGESRLTEREREVLRLVAQGLSSKTIGRQLFISERTVAQHLTAIFNKLGVHTRAQAVAVATRGGLL